MYLEMWALVERPKHKKAKSGDLRLVVIKRSRAKRDQVQSLNQEVLSHIART